MEVLVLIRLKDNPTSSHGYKKGDIVEINPKDELGNKALIAHVPVYVDMNIPCGSNFSYTNGKMNFNCGSCQYNDPDDCDKIKYQRAIWNNGDIDNPPTIIKKGKYNIDRNLIFTSAMLAIITKKPRTLPEQAALIAFSKANLQPTAIITDNEATI